MIFLEKELISVILTSYNSKYEFIMNTLKSIKLQTYKNFELIIVDDGSNNGVLDIVLTKFDFKKIKVIRQENKGLPAARNTGIENATGEYIAFIDDDDLWNENKLEICYKYIKDIQKTDSKAGLVFSFSTVIDEQYNYYGIYGFRVKGDISNKILGKNIIGPPSSVFVKKEVLQQCGGFDESYRYAEDIELWYRLTEICTVYSIDKALISYMYRKNSLSKNYDKMGEFSERALLETYKRRKINNNHVLEKYYIDYAYLMFSANKCKKYRAYYKKLVKISKRNILNLKLTLGYVLTLFGVTFLTFINNIRRNNNDIPPAYRKIYDYID